MAATAAFDWERALQQDRRLPRMQQLVESILYSNFPAVADKLRKDDPPARQYAPPSTAKPEMAAAAMSSSATRQMPKKMRQSFPIGEPPQPEYLSASESSEMDPREVDPMDELSDFETQSNESQQEPPQQETAQRTPREYAPRVPLVPQTEEDDSGNDVEMDEVEEEDDGDEDEDDDTACVVCNSNENEKQILLCDKCNGEYHLYCLSPPLTHVPDGEWFCPLCAPTQAPPIPQPPPATSSTNRLPPIAATATPLAVKAERQLHTPHQTTSVPAHQQAPASTAPPPGSTPESALQIKQERARQQQSGSNQASPPHSASPAPPQSIPPSPSSSSVAQAFESDAEKSNQLLIHACQCDDVKCVDPVHHEFCPHMKRFLRSACWASHSEKWRSFRVARVTAELFAYHALQCHEPHCNVPMCDQLRAEEFV